MNDLMITCAISDWFSAEFLFDYMYNNASYWLVFIFMAIESSFIPFPSEVVVPPAAYIAIKNPNADMNVTLIVLVATAGALVGSLFNYYFSMWVGRPVVYSFANSRLGHACLLDQQKVEKAEKYFDKHGAMSTLIGRLIPAVRQLISIPAGLAKMNIWVFSLFTVIGAGIWNLVLALLGVWLSKVVEPEDLFGIVEKYNHYFTIGGFILLLICLGIILWNAFKPRKANS